MDKKAKEIESLEDDVLSNHIILDNIIAHCHPSSFKSLRLVNSDWNEAALSSLDIPMVIRLPPSSEEEGGTVGLSTNEFVDSVDPRLGRALCVTGHDSLSLNPGSEWKDFGGLIVQMGIIVPKFSSTIQEMTLWSENLGVYQACLSILRDYCPNLAKLNFGIDIPSVEIPDNFSSDNFLSLTPGLAEKPLLTELALLLSNSVIEDNLPSILLGEAMLSLLVKSAANLKKLNTFGNAIPHLDEQLPPSLTSMTIAFKFSAGGGGEGHIHHNESTVHYPLAVQRGLEGRLSSLLYKAAGTLVRLQLVFEGLDASCETCRGIVGQIGIELPQELPELEWLEVQNPYPLMVHGTSGFGNFISDRLPKLKELVLCGSKGALAQLHHRLKEFLEHCGELEGGGMVPPTINVSKLQIDHISLQDGEKFGPSMFPNLMDLAFAVSHDENDESGEMASPVELLNALSRIETLKKLAIRYNLPMKFKSFVNGLCYSRLFHSEALKDFEFSNGSDARSYTEHDVEEWRQFDCRDKLTKALKATKKMTRVALLHMMIPGEIMEPFMRLIIEAGLPITFACHCI